MTKEYHIVLNVVPSRSTHQASLRIIRTRSGKSFIGKYSKSSAKQWTSELALLLTPFKKQNALEGALRVCIAWVFPHNKGTSKALLNKTIWKTTRPDLDNMEKGILDVLTEVGIISDDGLICSKETMKMHGAEPKIIIQIFSIDESDIEVL